MAKRKLCECGCGKPAPVSPRSYLYKGIKKGQTTRFIHGHYGVRHGFTRNGMKMPPELAAYYNARGRCSARPSRKDDYRNYAGREIKFLFVSFREFLAHVGKRPSPKHQLDRINNDGNYELGNVRWALPAVNHANQRKAWYGPCPQCGWKPTK